MSKDFSNINILTPKPGDSGRIRELDGLRGIAIAMVVIFHYFQLTIVAHPGSALAYLQAAARLSWTGVDLFFVLSGFLIGGILLDSRDSTNYYSVFYKRRFFRIVPIYAVALLLASVLLFLGLGPEGKHVTVLTTDVAPWYSYLTFTQNFWMTHAGSLGANGLGMTWSLAVEEQFYLTLPLYIRSLSKRWLAGALVIGVLSAPVLRNLLLQMRSDDWVGIYTMMLCRADALLLGVLAAVLLRNERWRERIRSAGLAFGVFIPVSLLGLSYLTLRAGSMTSPLMKSIGFTWVALFYVTILLFALTRPDSLLTKLFGMKWLCWLGTLAYGIYLFHQPVQYLLFRLMWRQTPAITSVGTFMATLGALALTLLLATLSWHFFEQPLIRMGRQSTFEFGGRPMEAPPTGARLVFR
jgi:peptidoglycan/LPS O-acetylase OafA/YrhL